MARRTLSFQLSQGDSPECSISKKKQGTHGGARNHHITEFFKRSSQPGTPALLSTLSNESMKIQTQDVESWNKKSTTSPRLGNIPTSSPNNSPSMEPCLSGRKEIQEIVRKFEQFCPDCGKSLLSPRVLLKRIILPVHSQVDLKDKGGYNISDDIKAIQVLSSNTGLHSPSIKCGSLSRSKSVSTVSGKSTSCNNQYFDSMCQATISRPSKCAPLKYPNLLKSDLQAPLDLCQDEITQKKNMNLIVKLVKTGSVQFGQQLNRTSVSNKSTSNLESVSESQNVTSTLKRKLDSQNWSYTSGSKNVFTERQKDPTFSQNHEDFKHFISATRTLECNQHGDNSFEKSADLGTGQTLPVISKPGLSHNTDSGLLLRSTSHLTKEGYKHSSPLSESSPGVVFDFQLASPALSDCFSLPETDDNSVTKSKKGSSYRAPADTLDSDVSFTGFSLSSDDDDEEEGETFKPLDEIFQMAAKRVPATPQKQNLDHSCLSLSPSPLHGARVNKNVQSKLQTPSLYVNNLDRLVKEKEESKRLENMEKLLHEDLEKGLGVANEEIEDSAEDGELTDEHRQFLEKFKLVTNAIPDQHPGEEVFNLPKSGAIFNLHTLDLRHSEFSAGSSEESIIFSCSQENQIMLATEGFLTFLYRFKKCPDLLMRWMFQMVSIHPSYAVSVKVLHTLIEISCNNLSNLQEKPWTPSLLDIATVFANMGIDFDILFPLPHIRPSFTAKDFGPALPQAGLSESRHSEPIFSRVPEFQIAHVIKFLGYCSAVCKDSFCDLETLALIVLLLKLHLEKELKDSPAMDLHCLIETLLQNIKSWKTVMPEMFYAISELSTHHHNFIKLLQLIPTSETRGRQLRKHLSLIFMSNILYGKCTHVPLDYDSQMLLICQLMSQMRPSSLVKEIQKRPENKSKTSLDLDQEAYYLTFSLLHLVNDASSSDEPPSAQRKYLLKLCTALEKHIKSDIREDARFFYRTKVKDLVARIHGRWQELLLYSRPNQGKLRDYWEPVRDASSPDRSQEVTNDAPPFLYDDNVPPLSFSVDNI
ncbi:SMC5-SMC6 complex localization factor protein 2 isoform X2 [Rhinoderma darwinii]|uniref:SMC5-SMC6 complex localization factor protein 2 isoform X2 n=1 Tax=Rhinoderma darwinii TaxID=43563 RepID=UPI003F67470F